MGTESFWLLAGLIAAHRDRQVVGRKPRRLDLFLWRTRLRIRARVGRLRVLAVLCARRCAVAVVVLGQGVLLWVRWIESEADRFGRELDQRDHA